MADLKPLQILLLMAPLLLASQLDSVFAHTDTATPNLPQETTNGGPLSSSDPHLPPPRNNQTADQNRRKKIIEELVAKLSPKRFRSHRVSIRKRRKRQRQRRAWRHASSHSSQGYILMVSLPNICFAILSLILHNLVSVNSL